MTHGRDHMPTLPNGWEWAKMEDVVDILDRRRIPVNAKERGKRTAGKSKSELYPYYGAAGQVGWIDGYIFDEELVLLGEDGAPFFDPTKSKAYTIRGKTWVNNHAHVLRGREGILLNRFLCHYLNTFDFHGYVTGTTRHKLNQSQMRRIPIPIPPLSEQHHIVAKIEKLFSGLDSAAEALGKAESQAVRLRQSILRKACAGELVSREPVERKATLSIQARESET